MDRLFSCRILLILSSLNLLTFLQRFPFLEFLKNEKIVEKRNESSIMYIFIQHDR